MRFLNCIVLNLLSLISSLCISLFHKSNILSCESLVVVSWTTRDFIHSFRLHVCVLLLFPLVAHLLRLYSKIVQTLTYYLSDLGTINNVRCLSSLSWALVDSSRPPSLKFLISFSGWLCHHKKAETSNGQSASQPSREAVERNWPRNHSCIQKVLSCRRRHRRVIQCRSFGRGWPTESAVSESTCCSISVVDIHISVAEPVPVVYLCSRSAVQPTYVESLCHLLLTTSGCLCLGNNIQVRWPGAHRSYS